MQRHQLQHVILEIGRRFDLGDFYIIGSASTSCWRASKP